MVRFCAIAAVVAAAALSADGEQADWTVLVYMDGDNNLEHTLVQNLEDLAATPPSPRVRIAVQVSRSAKDAPEGDYCGHAAGGIAPFKGVKRLEVAGNGVLKEVADLGAANMGDPAALGDFLAWGLKAYPADRVALVLADHGFSWPGWGVNESNGGKGLTLPELREALARGTQAAGGRRLDLVGFDSCLMGSLDVMAACQEHARWFVASPELEPGFGWPYKTWLSPLVDAPKMDPEELATLLCDAYKAFFALHPAAAVKRQGSAVTLAVVDLDKIPAVIDALDAAVGELTGAIEEGNAEAWEAVCRAVDESEEYGRTGGQPAHARDLRQIAQNLAGMGEAGFAEVAAAVEAAVAYRIQSRSRPHAWGISVYFPPDLRSHEKAGQQAGVGYAQAAGSPAWAKLVDAQLAVEARDTTAPVIAEIECSDETISPGDRATLTAAWDEGDVAEAFFALAVRDGEGSLDLGRYPVDAGDGRVEETFDGTWLALGDGERSAVVAIDSYELVDAANERYFVGIPALYQPTEGGEWEDVTLYGELVWTLEACDGQFVYAFRTGDRGASPVSIEKGDRIRPVYLRNDDHGDELVPSEETLVLGDEGLQFQSVALADGEYLLGFRVLDHAGNGDEQFATIKVSGEE